MAIAIQENKEESKKKRRRAFIIWFFIAAIILAIVLPVTLCKSKPSPAPVPPPPAGFVIDDNIQGDDNAMYEEGGDVNTATIIPDSIDLKKLGELSGENTFVLKGEIKHTIFIPADFSCSLYGEDGSSIFVDDSNRINSTFSTVGIIIGNDEPEQDVFQSEFNIASNFVNLLGQTNGNVVNGIFINSTVGGTLTIDDNNIFGAGTDTAAYVTMNAITFKKDIVSNASVVVSNNTFYTDTKTSKKGIIIKDIYGEVIISDNTFYFYLGSVYNVQVDGIYGKIEILDNVFFTSSGDLYSIYFTNNLYGVIKIVGNIFSSTFTAMTGYGELGVTIRFPQIKTGASIEIANNIFFTTSSGNRGTYVIWFNGGSESNNDIEITGNIFNITTVGTPAPCLYFYTSFWGCKITNNIFYFYTQNYDGSPFYCPGSNIISGELDISQNTFICDTVSGRNSTAINVSLTSSGSIVCTGSKNKFYYSGNGNAVSIGGSFTKTDFFIGDGNGIKTQEMNKGEYVYEDQTGNSYKLDVFYADKLVNGDSTGEKALFITKLESYTYTNETCSEIVGKLVESINEN